MLRRFSLSLFLLPASLGAWAQTHVGDVVYGHKSGMALTMEVYKPAKPNHIAVVFMISGGWVSDYSRINPVLAKVFTDRGMTVFEVLHGSQPKFQIPEIVSDVNRAIRFIRTNAATFSIDPRKIGVSGMSAGGHLSLMLGAYGKPGKPDARDPIDRASSEVNAIACFYPPTDFLNWGGDGKVAMESMMLTPFWPAFGIAKETPHDKLMGIGHDLSPIYGVTASFPPTLIFHGDADMLVPIQQSEIFIKKLQSVHVASKLVIKRGAGHGYATGLVDDLGACADWFTKYLGK